MPKQGPITPDVWVPGDPGYEPVEEPPDTFFHVVAAPEGTSERTALVIHSAFKLGQMPSQLDGRHYLVTAVDQDDAQAQVERIEKQIADNDALHQQQFGKKPWQVHLVTAADAFLDAGRDPEPALPHEARVLDVDAAARRRMRLIQAGRG